MKRDATTRHKLDRERREALADRILDPRITDLGAVGVALVTAAKKKEGK